MREAKKQIYNDVWFFYKKHINCDNSDECWEQIKQEAQELVKKYVGDMFVRELLAAVINELSRKE